MNKTVHSITRVAATLTLAGLLASCEAKKSRNPLSPTVAGPIAGVSIDAPVPVSPVNGAEVVNTEPLRLVFDNGRSNGERPLHYVVEVGSDAQFSSTLYANGKVTPSETGRTSIVVDGTFVAERTYFWRVKAADGANESGFSAAARFDLVVPVILQAPEPISPAGGQTISSDTPTLVARNGRVQGRVGAVEYRYFVSRDPGFANVVAEIPTMKSDGTTTSVQTAALPGNATLYWRVIASNGTIRDFSGVQHFRTPGPPAPPAPGPPGPTPPAGPACQNGVLANPRAYFFSLIGRSEGQPAGDWASVLQRSGLPAGPVAGQTLPPNAPFYGITQQINSSGQVRGRIFLPTDVPDEHGYYIHQVDILSDASATSWVWRPLGGPPYAPRPCQ
jgi:hypothetical protein